MFGRSGCVKGKPERRRAKRRMAGHALQNGGVEGFEPRLLMSHTLMVGARFSGAHHAGHAWTNYVVAQRNTSGLPMAFGNSSSGFTPDQIRSAYDFSGISFGAVTADGSGQTIAIVDAYNDPTIAADLHAFDLQYGLPDPTFVELNQNGGTNLPRTDPAGRGNSWATETALDVEWAHAMAPGAAIVLVEANSDSDLDLMGAANTAKNYPGVSVVSMSWGSTESSSDLTDNAIFTTPAMHNPITFLASSGDDGAYDNGSKTTKTVSYPAASPNVVAVGGTTLTLTADGTYQSEAGWGNGNTSAADGGSGGGISTVEAQPIYQAGVVTQTSTRRAVPDVAAVGDPSTGVAVYDSWDSPNAPWSTIAGTSLSAPIWAGLVAVADQGRALLGSTSLSSGQTLSLLYSAPANAYHDVASGNNGYAAEPGYDLVTGRGTPIASTLVPFLLTGNAGASDGVSTSPAVSGGGVSAGPVNDLFASATAISGTAISLTATNVGATREKGEPIIAHKAGGSSVWWAWTAPTGGHVSLDTAGSDFDTLLGVYTGNAVSKLHMVAMNDDDPSSLALTSVAGFNAIAGQTYYFVVDGFKGATGTINLNLGETPAPANDNFVNALPLSGTAVTWTGSNFGATKEPGEKRISGNVGGSSVWFAWTAPANLRMSLSTAGSSFDTLLGVYAGNAVAHLAKVAQNDDAGSLNTSAVTFNAVARKTYYFAVDGFNGETGNIALNLTGIATPARRRH